MTLICTLIVHDLDIGHSRDDLDVGQVNGPPGGAEEVLSPNVLITFEPLIGFGSYWGRSTHHFVANLVCTIKVHVLRPMY